MRLFELDDRPVALFDANNALVFAAGQWRPVSISMARSALISGCEMSLEKFAAAFPDAAASLWRVDSPGFDGKPN